MNLSRDIIEKGNNKILVASKEPFLINECVEKIRSIFKDYAYKMCPDIDAFLEVYHRGELFDSQPTIICLWDLDAIAVKELYNITNLPTNDILVFIERKTLAKNKAYTNFKSECHLVKIEAMTDRDCLKWVSSRMVAKNLRFDRDIPKILVDMKSSDLHAIDSEIRKLEIIYEDKEIDKTAVRYISESSEAKVFEFMEHLLHKRRDKALKEFHKFSEDYYVKLIFMVINNIEKIYKIGAYRSQNKSAEEISDLIGINKFIVKTKYFTVLSIYNKVKLLKLLDLFNELDFKLRTSSMPKRLLFEAYILKAFNV